MKKLKGLLSALVPALLFIAGCDQQVLSPEEGSVSNAVINGCAQSGPITFLHFETRGISLAKPIVDTQMISANEGGELTVAFNWGEDSTDDYGEDNQFSDSSSYRLRFVPLIEALILYASAHAGAWLRLGDATPGALDADTELSLTLNASTVAGEVDMVFSPHGTVFNTPAILNIKALNLELKDLSKKDIDIYYDNRESGYWEKMESHFVKVNTRRGNIWVKDALLPHFSRYAVAYGW